MPIRQPLESSLDADSIHTIIATINYYYNRHSSACGLAKDTSLEGDSKIKVGTHRVKSKNTDNNIMQRNKSLASLGNNAIITARPRFARTSNVAITVNMIASLRSLGQHQHILTIRINIHSSLQSQLVLYYQLASTMLGILRSASEVITGVST